MYFLALLGGCSEARNFIKSVQLAILFSTCLPISCGTSQVMTKGV